MSAVTQLALDLGRERRDDLARVALMADGSAGPTWTPVPFGEDGWVLETQWADGTYRIGEGDPFATAESAAAWLTKRETAA